MLKPLPPFQALHGFFRNERGATAVEFALVSAPFMGIMLAIFQTGLIFLSAEGLEASVREASRAIMTGEAQTNSIATAAQFRDNLLCSPTAPRKRILPSFMDCSKLVIDVQKPTTFASADIGRSFYSGSTTYSPGGAGCITVVRVAYPIPVFLPILTAGGVNTAGQVFYNGSMAYIAQSAAVFRNEPFSTGASAC